MTFDYKVEFANVGSLIKYGLCVVFPRHSGRWLFLKPEKNGIYKAFIDVTREDEKPLEAAQRQLFGDTKETADVFRAAFDFSIQGEETTGQVFLVELATLPESLLSRVESLDQLPLQMEYYSVIQPLYHHLQGWLNLQSSPGELWDVYDANRKLTGRTHRRADPLAAGDYHLVVHVWIINSRGEFLISQRAPNKGYPFMWECTGGSALAGDSSREAAIREVEEELGLTVLEENGICLFTLARRNDFCDVWLFQQDFELAQVRLQEQETIAAKWVSWSEIESMIASSEFFPFDYLERLYSSITDGKQGAEN